MNQCTVMEQALIGAIRGIRDRVDQAVAGKEVWTYQLGDAPHYVGNNAVVDDCPDNDSITVSFFKSPWDVYDYRIRIIFLDFDGVIDAMIIDVGLEEGRFNVMPDYSNGEDDATDVQMLDGAPFVFYPVEDLCTVLSALSFITEGEKLYAEKAASESLKAEEKKVRRGLFKVIDGSKSS